MVQGLGFGGKWYLGKVFHGNLKISVLDLVNNVLLEWEETKFKIPRFI
jgi:hypothetical protein